MGLRIGEANVEVGVGSVVWITTEEERMWNVIGGVVKWVRHGGDGEEDFAIVCTEAKRGEIREAVRAEAGMWPSEAEAWTWVMEDAARRADVIEEALKATHAEYARAEAARKECVQRRGLAKDAATVEYVVEGPNTRLTEVQI